MATREVGLMTLVEPEFISLVKSPANQTGFKIIRSKQEEDVMAHKDRNLRVRTKSARADGLLSIELPVGISEDDAKELIDTFGLGEDYELATNTSGEYYAKRTGDYDETDTTPIDLGNGFVANIATQTLESRSDSTIAGVTLVGLEFDETFEDVDSVKRWIEERDINFQNNGVETFEGGTVVTRHDTPEGEQVRKVRLDNGVTGVVAKTKDTDVPTKVYRSVVEQSYGNWGWGHLNFATALADPAFSDASWDAIYVLRDVLENVIIYSGLPLDDRKSLVQNVCDQFTQYMTSLIDSLPREVIKQTSSDSNSKKEPDTMAKKDDNKKVERTDDDTDTVNNKDEKGAEVETKAARNDEDSKYITRDDLEEVVGDVVAKVMAKQTKRSDEDEAAASDTPTSESGGADNAIATALESVAGAVSKIGDAVETVTRDMESLKKDVEDMSGETVTRTDDDEDGESDDGESIKRTDDQSCFDGMFGDRFKQ